MSRSQNQPRPYGVFVVEDEGEAKSFWTRVGSAWPHRDGAGFNVAFAALPVNSSRLVIRKPRQDREAGR
jgi:hypothetical protein